MHHIISFNKRYYCITQQKEKFKYVGGKRQTETKPENDLSHHIANQKRLPARIYGHVDVVNCVAGMKREGRRAALEDSSLELSQTHTITHAHTHTWTGNGNKACK